MAQETGRARVDRKLHATAAGQNAHFESAQQDAEGAGLPRYDAWCVVLERRYTVMPLWYWDSAKRRATYRAHIRATLEWQRKQAQINAGNRDFLRKLRGTTGS
jgi:hypothetical protein